MPRSARALLSIIAVVFVTVNVAGCVSSTTSAPERRVLALADFSEPPADLKTDVVEISAGVLGGPEEIVIGEIISGPQGTEVQAQGEVRSTLADGTTEIDAVSPKVTARAIEPGESWPVEGLVGQVNGRPIFADAFFDPIEDRLLTLLALQDRVEARRALVEFVRRQFKETVDSELIVAEAESKLSPEQQQGVFAWLKSLQEETIAQLGGTRAAAEASIEAESTMTLEQFMQQRRDVSLAQRLLNERIEPRTIVAWRDVVQEYELRKAEFNPPPTLRVGRIRLSITSDAALIESVKAQIAQKRSFSAIVAELKLPDGGFWNQFDLPPDGIKGLQLADAVKERLDGLAVDTPSESLEQRGFVMWLAVISIERAPERTLYNREVQLRLENEIQARREIIERERYMATLRSRWVTDEIGEMERKLVEFALKRYWR